MASRVVSRSRSLAYGLDDLDLSDALDWLDDDRGLHDHDYRLCDHCDRKTDNISATVLEGRGAFTLEVFRQYQSLPRPQALLLPACSFP